MLAIRRFLAALALAVPALAIAAAPIAMHRDPGCPCCLKWAAQVRAQFGRQVQVIDDSQRALLQKRLGVPADLASCHTAVIDGMVFEGHVPIADMKRVLAQRPKGVAGLAVAGMPTGSEGMEMRGQKGQAYDVIAFGPGGRRVFAHHAA
ncbi:MAG: metal-binding protein [Alphaproteobacteria bacterium]|nr:metal-binding protein [Alphaproteobacteria bacterium]